MNKQKNKIKLKIETLLIALCRLSGSGGGIKKERT
jgi:hypothetical protein